MNMIGVILLLCLAVVVTYAHHGSGQDGVEVERHRDGSGGGGEHPKFQDFTGMPKGWTHGPGEHQHGDHKDGEKRPHKDHTPAAGAAGKPGQ